MTQSPTVKATRWKGVAIGLTVMLVGLVVWDGADRGAADATQPLSQGSAGVMARGDLPVTLKLASFNIHGGKGIDGVRNLSRIADLLPDIDFAGLYEVRAISDGHQTNQAATIAALRQESWLFAPTERQWWCDHFGNGLVHRIPVRSVIRIPLINTRGKAYRNAILSTVEIHGGDVRIIAVHIDRENDRRSQLQTMIELFLSLQPPCALMGDLNTTGSDEMIESLRNRAGVQSPLHDSFDSTTLASNIDWIFTRGLKTVSIERVENSASDHPVLRAELVPVK